MKNSSYFSYKACLVSFDHRKLSKDSKEIGRPLLSKGNLHFSLVEENQNDYDKKTKIVKQYVWFVGVFSNLYNFNCLRPGGMKTKTKKTI